MQYAILQKDLETEVVTVVGVYDDRDVAVSVMETLIESTDDFGFKIVMAGEFIQ